MKDTNKAGRYARIYVDDCREPDEMVEWASCVRRVSLSFLTCRKHVGCRLNSKKKEKDAACNVSLCLRATVENEGGTSLEFSTS